MPFKPLTVFNAAWIAQVFPVSRLARFAAVGIFGSLTYYVVLAGMVEVLGIDVLTATSIAFVLVVVETYLLHRHWTFESDIPHQSTAPKFAFMTATGFFLNWFIMHMAVRSQINYLLAQTCAIVVVVTWNFIVSWFWVFGRSVVRQE